MKFKTASGTEYEVDTENLRVRRANAGTSTSPVMRRDNEWLKLSHVPQVDVGYPAIMVIEPLAPGADVTFRTTNIVTEVTP